MKLPRGVTGFRHQVDPELATCDLRLFRTHCYEIAWIVGASLVSQYTLPAAGNYSAITFSTHDSEIAVLLNNYIPLVAFASPPPSSRSLKLQVTDAPELATEFEKLGTYHMLSMQYLNSAPTDQICENLAPAEKSQLSYWKPRTVGEIVFNFWD